MIPSWRSRMDHDPRMPSPQDKERDGGLGWKARIQAGPPVSIIDVPTPIRHDLRESLNKPWLFRSTLLAIRLSFMLLFGQGNPAVFSRREELAASPSCIMTP